MIWYFIARYASSQGQLSGLIDRLSTQFSDDGFDLRPRFLKVARRIDDEIRTRTLFAVLDLSG